MANGPSVRLLGECGVTRSFGVVCFFDFPDFSFIPNCFPIPRTAACQTTSDRYMPSWTCSTHFLRPGLPQHSLHPVFRLRVDRRPKAKQVPQSYETNGIKTSNLKHKRIELSGRAQPKCQLGAVTRGCTELQSQHAFHKRMPQRLDGDSPDAVWRTPFRDHHIPHQSKARDKQRRQATIHKMLANTVERAPTDSTPPSRQQPLLHLSRHSESVSSFQAEGLPSRLGQVLLLELFRLHTSIVGLSVLSAPSHSAHPSKPWDRCGPPREELPLYLRL